MKRWMRNILTVPFLPFIVVGDVIRSRKEDREWKELRRILNRQREIDEKWLKEWDEDLLLQWREKCPEPNEPY